MDHTSAISGRTSAKASSKKDESAAFRSSNTHVRKLITFFLAWKSVLLLVALASPGPGYDTSTQLFLQRSGSIRSPSSFTSSIEHLASKLTRWDAIYFVSSSSQGQIFEQEWAFSGVFAQLTAALTTVFPSNVCTSAIACHALSGIIISHISHLLAVLCLYKLTFEILSIRNGEIAFTAAFLHIISPAGLFLSAPYGESTFAAAHFAGQLCYVLARKNVTATPAGAFLLLLLSGVLIGFATTIRSNGLLTGSIFFWDAISFIPQLRDIITRRNFRALTFYAGIVAAGILIGAGYIIPQALAYQEFCTADNIRPWCEKGLPSIYTFVQERYWNVGFLRYWTVSNIPLFLLATPMLLMLGLTALDALRDWMVEGEKEREFERGMLGRLALPQIILTGLAITSFHTQIVNRVSSGYAGWYIAVALALHEEGNAMLKGKGQWIVRAMVVYAVVQGGLYASFMPPA
ncbi:related to GPI mannosyltransferase 2 [Ramularia collo-cygni]|uniref:GPI mannosyltransferase 2 n=1 Tax=Ramularia collo-cygni TaxID=112498 RepID=A0A2D3UZ54_9PEZI|nr:related to GPI mannosyltransferase 2 [Ramularia collo-cygni]CZT15454.1 related to GPI mannosyltransferase 2 [Ramularia collo-cygni]